MGNISTILQKILGSKNSRFFIYILPGFYCFQVKMPYEFVIPFQKVFQLLSDIFVVLVVEYKCS